MFYMFQFTTLFPLTADQNVCSKSFKTKEAFWKVVVTPDLI